LALLLLLLVVLLLLLQGKQLVYSALALNSSVMPIPNAPKRCRMSLMVRLFTLPPAGQQAGGASAAGNKSEYKVSSSSRQSHK
jgi:hypothetical protein